MFPEDAKGGRMPKLFEIAAIEVGYRFGRGLKGVV